MEFSAFWFALYKLAKFAVYPYTWMVLLLGLLCVLVLGRVSTWRLLWIRVLTVMTLLLVWGIGSPLVAGFLTASLEEQYPPFNPATTQRFDTIVVLGGGVLPQGTLRPTDTLSSSSAERTMCGADLFQRGLATHLLFSGGDPTVVGKGPEEARVMKQLAMRLGIPEDAILIETRSRTTYESAVELSRVGGRNSVLLVTSAYHIPRALALFRKQGINTTPAPCGYSARHRTDHVDVTLFDFLPSAYALEMSTYAISELVGAAVYRAAGKL